jgi:hypothetical protein
MNRKYIAAGLVGFAFILGWNVFLIQRDQKMFEAYDSAIERLKQSPSNEIQ